LRELTLTLPGQVLSDRCESCAQDVHWLALDGVDQRLELRSKPAHTKPGRYTLQIYDWGGQHPRADVTGWIAAAVEASPLRP
ncbi:MAG: hypothetical protein ACI9EF_002917, partial [Pseudohongiellaceae bacterium]